jgi:hypothetical protein
MQIISCISGETIHEDCCMQGAVPIKLVLVGKNNVIMWSRSDVSSTLSSIGVGRGSILEDRLDFIVDLTSSFTFFSAIWSVGMGWFVGWKGKGRKGMIFEDHYHNTLICESRLYDYGCTG